MVGSNELHEESIISILYKICTYIPYLCTQVMETEAALEAAAMEAVELSVPPDEGQSTTAAATVKQEVGGFEASSEPAAGPALGEEEEQDVKTNPWYVDSLDHFRYYVCPECATTRYVHQ